MIKFAENIREFRINKGITQKELADLVNTNQSTISKWENGTLEPSLKELVKICSIFCCKADEILGLE